MISPAIEVRVADPVQKSIKKEINSVACPRNSHLMQQSAGRTRLPPRRTTASRRRRVKKKFHLARSLAFSRGAGARGQWNIVEPRLSRLIVFRNVRTLLRKFDSPNYSCLEMFEWSWIGRYLEMQMFGYVESRSPGLIGFRDVWTVSDMWNHDYLK